MRFLGGYVGAMFMGSAKVLGEEGVKKDDGEVVKDEQRVRGDDVKVEDEDEEVGRLG